MKVRERLARFAHPVVLLLFLAILAYGLLLPQMGFYWDELPMSWIRYELGPEAMTRYFSTNRPVWGMLYQVTTRLLPQVPIYWEVFGLFWRWVAAVLVWAIARNLWTGPRDVRAGRGRLFSAVPRLQPAVDVLSIQPLPDRPVLSAVVLPVHDLVDPAPAMVLAADRGGPGTFGAEPVDDGVLLRPGALASLPDLRDDIHVRRKQPALERACGGHWLLWSPYLAVFVANVLWRLFVFNNQIYQPTLASCPQGKAAANAR